MQKNVKITVEQYTEFVAMATILESVSRVVKEPDATVEDVKAIIGHKEGKQG